MECTAWCRIACCGTHAAPIMSGDSGVHASKVVRQLTRKSQAPRLPEEPECQQLALPGFSSLEARH